MKHIHVAVGVVEREEKVFVCLRAKDAHQGGLWEFPGGKVEEGESPLQALSREYRCKPLHTLSISPMNMLKRQSPCTCIASRRSLGKPTAKKASPMSGAAF